MFLRQYWKIFLTPGLSPETTLLQLWWKDNQKGLIKFLQSPQNCYRKLSHASRRLFWF